MITSREVDIYVNRYGIQATIPVVQYDSGRQIIFRLIDALIPIGSTANIFIRKPSGKSVYNTCEVSGNTVVVTLTNQSLAEYGNNEAQIRIEKSNEAVTCFDVIFDVRPSYIENAAESEYESTVFQNYVAEAQEAAEICKDAIESVASGITPELYGAKGDGVTDDTAAVQQCIDRNPGKTIIFSKPYLVSEPIKTSATDSEKVILKGTQGGKLIASNNFVGDWVIDICGKGTRTSMSNTDNITGADGLMIDTNGMCGGLLVERCHMAKISNCTIVNLGGYVGLQIDNPSEIDVVNSSDAYIDNVIINGINSNAPGCIGIVVNGHDNDIRNVRPNFVNVGMIINGSHNRIANAHPLRGAADSGYIIYETSKAFVINNNNIYLDNCYSDNFAVGIDVAKSGAIFFITNFTLLWWENFNVTHTFIKLEDDASSAADKIFWGHVQGADLLFKTEGTSKGIDGSFSSNTFARNPNCFNGIYIDQRGTLSTTDALFDSRLSSAKIDDFDTNATVISDLSTIKEGAIGRARFEASVSPTGANSIYIYECIGDSSRKILNAYYPANNKRYTNSFTGEWSGWIELSNIIIDDFNTNATVISDLSTIKEGTIGRARFEAGVSPTGASSIYIYECIGDSTRKILNAYYPSTKQRYINSYTGSWTGWTELT